MEQGLKDIRYSIVNYVNCLDWSNTLDHINMSLLGAPWVNVNRAVDTVPDSVKQNLRWK